MSNTLYVIGAMEDELAALRRGCHGDSTTSGYIIHRAGVGKVNAALAVAHAKQHGARGVIVVGTSGALNRDLSTGDIVVVSHAAQHDIDASPVGFPRGTIPFEPTSIWGAHPAWVEAAAREIETLGLRVVIGGAASGERFVADATERAWIREHFRSDCVDMETGAVAQACAKLELPWIGLRVISDGADRDAAASFTTALPDAAATIARIIPPVAAEILQMLPP